MAIKRRFLAVLDRDTTRARCHRTREVIISKVKGRSITIAQRYIIHQCTTIRPEMCGDGPVPHHPQFSGAGRSPRRFNLHACARIRSTTWQFWQPAVMADASRRPRGDAWRAPSQPTQSLRPDGPPVKASGDHSTSRAAAPRGQATVSMLLSSVCSPHRQNSPPSTSLHIASDMLDVVVEFGSNA